MNTTEILSTPINMSLHAAAFTRCYRPLFQHPHHYPHMSHRLFYYSHYVFDPAQPITRRSVTATTAE